MRLSSEKFKDIYLSLTDIIQNEFDAGRSHLTVLNSLAQRGEQLLPHPDWNNLRLLAGSYEARTIENSETTDANAWVTNQAPKADFARLNIFACDGWLLTPNWEYDAYQFDEKASDTSSGPDYIPPILADAARICVGWYVHSEFSYSDEELEEMKRQGTLTRKTGEGAEHLGEVALFPIVVWGCMAELQKYSHLLKATGTCPKNATFRGGYASGDSFTFHPQR